MSTSARWVTVLVGLIYNCLGKQKTGGDILGFVGKYTNMHSCNLCKKDICYNTVLK